MLSLMLLQAVASPDWVGPTVAISLAVLAFTVLVIAIVLGVVMIRLLRQIRRGGELVDVLRDDLGRTMKSVRRLTDQAQDILVIVRQEAGAYAQTGRRLRRQVTRGADRLQEKLTDLETLYEVVEEELEGTALDLAATLRAARSGNGMLGRVRRLVTPARR
jgi:methyl-accepting chemotaxis protein